VQLSAAASALRSSAIRDLLAVAERPEVLSMAGGLPCPDAIPVDDVAAAVAAELAEGAGALQYSTTEGDERLRTWVAAQAGLGATADDVLVTTGSQQALDLVCRALLEPGDHVAADDPIYLGAGQVLQLAQAHVHPLPVGPEGLDVERLEALLRGGAPVKLVYTVAAFQNPTGFTLAGDRRARLAALAERHGFVVVEDDPYGHLRWAGEAPPSIAAGTSSCVRLGTSSKTVGGGLRVGWAVLPPSLRGACTRIKQATDLHTSTLSQRILVRLLTRPGWYDAQVARIVPMYRDRALALDAALRAHLADELSWRTPDGGMFLWAEVKDVPATDALLPAAVEHGVAFVPGGAFSETAANRMRLSFSVLAPSEFDEAVRRLGAALTANRA
jgi:2-aminoadipate transaminase